jgi:hypothetical protein
MVLCSHFKKKFKKKESKKFHQRGQLPSWNNICGSRDLFLCAEPFGPSYSGEMCHKRRWDWGIGGRSFEPVKLDGNQTSCGRFDSRSCSLSEKEPGTGLRKNSTGMMLERES